MSCENDNKHDLEDYCNHCSTCHACLDESRLNEMEFRLSLQEQNAALVKELEAVKASIPKIKADAIMNAISECCPFYSGDIGDSIVREDSLIEYANSLINKEG